MVGILDTFSLKWKERQRYLLVLWLFFIIAIGYKREIGDIKSDKE